MDETSSAIPNSYVTPTPSTPLTPPTNLPSTSGVSKDTKTIVTVLLLIFVFPIGFLLMWFWSGWKVWVKFLVSVPITILTLIIVPAILLLTINPAKQFSLANNSKRASDVNTLISSIRQYQATNLGDLSGLGLPKAGGSPRVISSANGFIDFCKALVPEYLSVLPADPKANDGKPVESCDGTWDTNYEITQDSDGKITISAPATEAEATIVTETIYL